ncbi:MAG TPA: NADH-quinone oxidoreductase subunit N, partial [Actinomycetota bacterium]
MTPVLLAADSIQAPSISYSGLLPVLILLGAACLGVLVEAFVPPDSRWAAQTTVAVVGLVAALVAVALAAGTS